MNRHRTGGREENRLANVMLYMEYKLTNDEIAQLEALMIPIEGMPVEPLVWTSKPLLKKTEEVLPLEHEAGSESFLVAELEGRVVLSHETRLLEEKRLAKRGRKRKRYSKRGRFHHKTKAATKRKRNLKAWKEDPLTRIRYSFRQGVDIREDEWQRLIEPVWKEHQTETLRVRQASGKGGPLHVYNLILTAGRASGPKAVVYDGTSQAILDSMDSEFKDRVLELVAPTGG